MPLEPVPLGSRATPLCAALALALLGGAAAQEPEDAIDLAKLSLEQLMGMQVETVTGAARREQKQSEAPASVTVLTAKDIRRHGFRTLADALRSMRGIDVTDDRGYEHLGVRGFNPLGDYNSRVLVLVDGHRINDPIYDTAPIGLDFALDIDLVERIEFVRGPGSALYGSNAFLGVINILTRSTADLDGAELAASAGSHDTRSGRATWARATEDGGLVVSASAYGSEGDDFRYDEYAASPGGGETRGTDGERAHSVYTRWTHGPFSVAGVFASRTKDIPTGAYETVVDDDRNATSDSHAYVDLAYRRADVGPWDLTARLFYDDTSYSGRYVYDDGGVYVNRDRSEGRVLGSEVVASHDGIDGHHITVGVERRDALRQDQTNYDGAVYLDDERDSSTWGVFVQDEIALADGLGVTLGMRYDRYDSFGGTVNPRLAVIWSPRESTSLKALAGRAFRAPNAYELYYHDGFSLAKPNPDLDAETIRTFELVWEEDLGAGLRSSVSVWRYAIDDLITQVVDEDDGLAVFVNRDEVTARGLELELDGRFENGWRSRLSQVWQQSEDEDGEPLRNSPDHLTKFDVNAPLIDESLWLGLQLQHTGERRTLDDDRTDAALLTNLTLRWLDEPTGWDLSATVRNVFDVDVEVPGGSELAQDRLPLSGRSLIVQGRKRF